MPSILAYSDIQFIFMNPEMEMQGFPSKVYTIMACGRPLLVCSGKDTPIINFLQEHGCAKLITEKSLEKKVGENGGLAEFRLKKRTRFTGSKWCRGD